MIDVDRLNNTIEELEERSKEMKTASEYYNQLIEISGEVAATSNSQKNIYEIIEGTSKQLTDIKEENVQLIKKLNNSNEKITNDVKKLEDEILKNVQALSSENNKLYSDFQQFLNSKLDLFKSDVQLEIRETSSRLENYMEKDFKKIEQQAKNDLEQNKVEMDRMQNSITNLFVMQNKKIKVNGIIIVGVFIVSIISLIIKLQ
ncbi:hypothetical protein [Clostridium estertheticum]|uniref:hypothetical protein n=1 Tax=Clostridium estertheticum TaxID=238834 RepID=UPI001C7E0B66|nr:hypothetical protein [Clostridium estertheticum]MBX4268505.1 hypothetical protein [Clostridium estertheticum]WLC81436.1 hypothetical protein KTC98_09575 [Clostridium estertheticum]